MTSHEHRDLRDLFFHEFGRNNMCLLWHLKEVLRDMPAMHVLDVGGGIRVSRNICLPDGIESALVVDVDGRMLRALAGEFGDDRLRLLEGDILTADLPGPAPDLVYFIMSLPWERDPLVSLRKAVGTLPGYLIVANAVLTDDELSGLAKRFQERGRALADTLVRFREHMPEVDAVLETAGYYPLVVFRSASWSPSPAHTVRTVLYTRDRPDRVPYDTAKYIVQVNGKCTNNCPSCYVVKNDETMDAGIFRDLISGVGEGEVICLRGGEPPLSENLIEDFIRPSLARGIRVILESNGSFLGSSRYREYLELLAHENMELRLSLDREHFDFFPEHIRKTRIGWISRFIEDARAKHIRFGMFTLGMSMEQIRVFLKGFSVESWLAYIRPITKYSDIGELPIRGRYVDIKGSVHDSMSGEFIRKSIYGSYEDLVADGADLVSMKLQPTDSGGE